MSSSAYIGIPLHQSRSTAKFYVNILESTETVESTDTIQV